MQRNDTKIKSNFASKQNEISKYFHFEILNTSTFGVQLVIFNVVGIFRLSIFCYHKLLQHTVDVIASVTPQKIFIRYDTLVRASTVF